MSVIGYTDPAVNQRFFGLLTEKQVPRGAHRSTAEFEAAILGYLAIYNENPKPFIWTKLADQILASVARFLSAYFKTRHTRWTSYNALWQRLAGRARYPLEPRSRPITIAQSRTAGPQARVARSCVAGRQEATPDQRYPYSRRREC